MNPHYLNRLTRGEHKAYKKLFKKHPKNKEEEKVKSHTQKTKVKHKKHNVTEVTVHKRTALKRATVKV